MFSEMIKVALERDVVGQADAIRDVARGVTRLASGLTPSERTWCAFLFIGPTGTGRAHMVRSLARVLYGYEAELTVNCKTTGNADPCVEFLRQLEPLLASQPPPPNPSAPGFEMPGRPRIVLVQDLEGARKELHTLLAYLLESGQIALPSGRTLRLDNCMFFLTSGICTDQILDGSRLGFSGGTPESSEGKQSTTYTICREEAEKVFGPDLLTQFDNLIVFRPLDDRHLAEVLDRHFARMSRWLEQRGIRCVMLPAAREYLLGLVASERLPGAHHLVRVHRHEVEFPIADLFVSGALAPGLSVRLDHRAGDEHLHFSVQPTREVSALEREIPVTV